MYELSVYMQCQNVMRVQIQSRQTSSKIYNLWTEYQVETNPIKSGYCKCKTGARLVGCCAHIAAVLRDLGHYRRNDLSSRLCPTYELNVEDTAKALSDWSDAEGDQDRPH